MDKNVAEDEVRQLRRKLEEFAEGNEDDLSDGGRHVKCHQSAPDESGKEDRGEESIRQAGHYFLLVCGPWLRRGEKIFQMAFDNSYTEKTRFENGHNKIQGQLRDILTVLPEKFHDNQFTSKLMSKMVSVLYGCAQCGLDSEFPMPQFLKGMNSQCSNTATRLRHHCATIFGVDATDMLRSST